MASTSTSSVQKSFKYDVFLSFRGEDIRYSFVSHLYKALEQQGILSYKDDEKIEKGETTDTQLIKSIEESRFFIIVFSKDYAGSSWCLDELVKIMECRKTSEQTAYPVFYDVDPTEIRKQSGPVGKAFEKHENKEAAGKWRKALNEAGNLAGWELKKAANRDESKLIQIIVDDIFKKICSSNSSSSSVDRKLVGMETRIEALLSSIEPDADDVRMIGIWGMGGGGKTTLATAIFNQICHQFEGSSFVDNVREVSKSSLSGLKELQKQILTDIFGDQNIIVSSVSGGKNKMVQMMCRKKVLVVLDDVDCTQQLEALAGDPNWYKPGSRIIITTRDEQVLVAHRVDLINNVTLLSHTEAIRLFNRYAFTKETPIQGHKELSRQVVEYAHGLPLTIKVLGSLLCGQNEREWKDALKRLKTVPLKETMKILELSYDTLDDDYKEIFLDVACILKGWWKEDVVIVLESCGFHAINGLRVLEQRSLITISEYGKLGMHDHIEEMAKNIVRRPSPNEPKRHSRLWNKMEIAEIVDNDSGTQATKCIKLLETEGLNFEMLMKGLANMKELKFLQLNTEHISVVKVSNWNLPNALRFLRWDNYPFSCLPKTFQAKNLVGLEMYTNSMVQLWKDGEEKPFPNLRFLRFYFSFSLRTLDLSVAPNLETLILESCCKLVEVKVPMNLETLKFNYCTEMVELKIPVECPKLVHLIICNSKLRSLHLGIIPNLETLTLKDCTDMVGLHMPAQCPKLVNLDLRNTLNLETLSLCNCMIKNLSLNGSKLRSLHLGLTPDLETLSLAGCESLTELHMPFECPKLKFLSLRNTKLTTLDLELTPDLQTLDLKECHDLAEINAPFGCLRTLRYLDLTGCGRFESFFMDKRFPLVDVDSLLELYVTLASFENTSPKSWLTSFYIRHPVVRNLEKLISVRNLEISTVTICDFQCLRKLTLKGGFPEVLESVVKLKALEELILLSTKIKHLPESICMLKYLKTLELKSCWILEKLPENFGQLQCLEKLILIECVFLRYIPNSICEMKCLKYLHLPYCFQVSELPEEIGRLECLKELDITGTCISRLPGSIFRVKGMCIVGSRWLLESCGFTSEIKTYGDETFCYI